MKIRYNKSLNDFVAFQMYHYEHTKKETPLSHKIMGWLLLLILLCSIGGGLYLRNYKLVGFCILVVVIYIFLLKRRPIDYSMAFYKRAEYYYSQGKHDLVGESALSFDTEHMYCESVDSQTRQSLDSIEKIILTPDYLFLYTDPVTAHYIPRKGIVDGDFDAFAAGLSAACQNAAANRGTEGQVIQSDWVFRKENIQKGLSLEQKANKVTDIVIWIFIFGAVSMFISFMSFGLTMHFAYKYGWVEGPEDVPRYVLYIVVGTPVLFGLLGALLAFQGKLPRLKIPFVNR